MIAHVKQPTDNTCVAAVVAMLTGASIEDAVRWLPPGKNGVEHRRMVEVLRERGVACDDRLMVLRDPSKLPELCVVRVAHPGKRWGHVVLKVGRQWHDPLLDAPFTGDLPASREWAGGSRVTSFLRVHAH